jgi:RimJ/RimL family protein N-acetyltransferase
MDLDGTLVRLRAYRGEDVDALADIFRDVEVVRWAGPAFLDPLGPSEIRRWSERGGWERVHWTVEDRHDGAVMGDVSLFRIDHVQRHCWFGITLGPATRLGRGRGTEATTLATRFAFHWLNLEKVYLGVFEGNDRAVATYRRAGYQVEARLRRHAFIDGALRDELWMAAYRDHPLYAV